MHPALCRGALPTLRSWQAKTAIESEYGAEAIARCNARIAADVVQYVTTFALDPASALLNATRPWERLCSFPSDCELALRGGTSAADLSQLLASSTRHGLHALLEASMEPVEAHSIACQLVSESHVAGLMQRLLLNTFQWSRAATSPSELSLRFGGVFMLTSCANHECQPNVELKTSWSVAPEAEEGEEKQEGEKGSTGNAEASGRRGERGDEARPEGGSFVRECCSMVLRTVRPIASGAELHLSYVDVGMNLEERRARLVHWGFHCSCGRCAREEAEQAQSAKRNRGSKSVQA